jgi:PAS domain S-box-containing protein
VGFAKITRDLTERRSAENLLRSSEEQFRLLVQSVSDYAIYMLSPAGEISTWNLGAARIKGYRQDEVIGTHFSRFYTPEDREAHEPERALQTACDQGRFEKEGWRVRKDGSRFWASIVIDAVRDDQGKLVGFAKITRDITAQRESRIALEEARESLFQSQKMDAIGQLTGGVAHDFNNLLTAIVGSLDMLSRRLPDDPKTRSLVNNALQGARRGAALTQRMLAFARRQELRMAPVDLPALVEGMAALFNQSIRPGIYLDIHLPAALPRIQSDANQLELALLNLVVNARDAMPSGGHITVRATEVGVTDASSTLQPGSYVCLSVTDTGVGMDETTLARAGEPFFTTKGVGKGTGLGLPMVLGIAQQSGGSLLLKSEKDAGTTAELWLPVTLQEPAKKIDPPKPNPVLRSLTVLTVDDDSLVLTNTVAMLEDLGHTAISVSSASEALNILSAGTAVDLMITDHVMPDMTGAELAEAARAQRPTLPIILASGYAELTTNIASDLSRLAKPFDQTELARAIGVAIDESNRKVVT